MLYCIWWYILVYTSSYWYILVYCSRTEYIEVLVGILKIQKLCMSPRIKPETSRIISSMLDRFATSVTSTVTVCNLDGICSLVLLKTLFFTWWLVSYEFRTLSIVPAVLQVTLPYRLLRGHSQDEGRIRCYPLHLLVSTMTRS